MNNKKIIILYSTGGMGHKKAAMALLKAFRAAGDVLEVEAIDVIEHASRVYKFLYLDFYVYLMSAGRWLWSIMYYFSNLPLVDLATRRLRAFLDYNSLTGLGKMLINKQPDAVIATHFLLPSIAEVLRKDKRFHAKMFTVITDYGPHSYWLSDHMDMFFVGSDSASAEVAKRGVPPERIKVTGIPTTDDFIKDQDIGGLRAKYGLASSGKTIFLMSGGYGVGPIEEMLLELNKCASNIQVIVVCGHNKEVYEDVKALQEKLKYPVVLFGFTDKVAELMAVSDLMITKAGGISSTEALNARLPMVLFASIPGQETWNERFLVSSGAAEKAVRAEDIPAIADRVLGSDEVYSSFLAGIDKVRRPCAAEDIVKVVLGEIEQPSMGAS